MEVDQELIARMAAIIGNGAAGAQANAVAPVPGVAIGNYNLTEGGVYRPLRNVANLIAAIGNQAADPLDEGVAEMMLGGLSNVDREGLLASLYELFAYDGFNPQKTASLLWSRRGAGVERAEFENEMMTLIIIFLKRGSNVEKIMMRSNANARALFNGLKLKYQIVKSGKTKETITLPRISACFPHITCKVIAVLGDAYTPLGAMGDLHRRLAFSGAIALLPAGNLWIPHYLKWALSQNEIINSSRTDKKKQAVIDFAKVSYSSTVNPLVGRANSLARLGRNVNTSMQVEANARNGENRNCFLPAPADIRNDPVFNGLTINWADFGFNA